MTDVSAIAVIGLGKLGTPLAACLAARGFRVAGADADPAKVTALASGSSPVFEPGVDRLLARAEGRLTATLATEEAVASSEATFVVVPTPSDPDGTFSLRFVLSTCEAIGRALREKEGFHTVAITSTVMPGSTGGPIRAALEQASGERAGEGFGLCYSPDFIALGEVVRGLVEPDFVLVGESDARAGDAVASVYARLCENDPPIARMSLVEAELAKLAVNTFVTTKISFANMLARLCERLPDADVDRVTAALGLDSRIGPRYLRGAIGYGGPCFPRDNLALASLARELGVPTLIAEATDEANRAGVDDLVALVLAWLPEGGGVGVLGLAYKPDTDVVEASQGLLLARALAGRGVEVVAYDPAAMESARRELDGRVRLADSLEACIESADVLVLATPWDELRRLEPAQVARDGAPRVVIDCWRVLERSRFEQVAEYVALGTSGATPRRAGRRGSRSREAPSRR